MEESRNIETTGDYDRTEEEVEMVGELKIVGILNREDLNFGS